jgi:hypothetical protein
MSDRQKYMNFFLPPKKSAKKGKTVPEVMVDSKWRCLGLSGCEEKIGPRPLLVFGLLNGRRFGWLLLTAAAAIADSNDNDSAPVVERATLKE